MSDPVDLQSMIPINEAPRHLPAGLNGKPVNAATIFRWRTRGVGGVKLEGRKIGGRWFTSVAWIREFIEATTAGAAPATVGQIAREAANTSARKSTTVGGGSRRPKGTATAMATATRAMTLATRVKHEQAMIDLRARGVIK